jgi:hypothetical protein
MDVDMIAPGYAVGWARVTTVGGAPIRRISCVWVEGSVLSGMH